MSDTISNPNTSHWNALRKIVKRLPANLAYYGSALGAIVLAGGGQLPPGLEFVAGSIGGNMLSNMISDIIKDEDLLDDEIRRRAEEAIRRSDIANLLTKQDFLHGYARLIQRLDAQKNISQDILDELRTGFSNVATSDQVEELRRLLQQIITTNSINAGVQSTVFISYSRKNRDFAKDLYTRLHEEGFKLWRDVHDIEAGADDWWQSIKEGIEQCDTLILCMSLPALKSPVVSDEWFYARQLGKRVIPVVADDIWTHAEVVAGEFTIPNWMSRRNWIDYRSHLPEAETAWKNLVRTLNTTYEPKRFINMVADLPPRFVRRPEDIDLAIRSLVDDNNDAVAMTTALRGAGGYGKTTLAKAIARDVRIQGAFDDGILWVTLGEELLHKKGDALKNILISMILEIIYALTEERPVIETLEMASTKLKEAIGEHYILLVIDDVWEEKHLKPFLVTGKNSASLITTRNADTVNRPHIAQQSVDRMKPFEATDLLSAGFDPDEVDPLKTEFHSFSHNLREYPLLLALANTTISNLKDDLCISLREALKLAREIFTEQGILGFDDTDSTERSKAVDRTLSVSLNQLNEDDQQRYLELAIFREDSRIPLSILEKYWGMSKIQTLQYCQRLYRKTALLHSFEGMSIRIHDVFRDYLNRQFSPNELQTLHLRLINSWNMPDSLSDDYAWRNIAYHSNEAGKLESFYPFLFQYDWLKKKLASTDIYALLSDLDIVSQLNTSELKDATRQLISAFSMSAHVLSQPSAKSQLANQLSGRLNHNQENRLIISLLEGIHPEPNTLTVLPTMTGQSHLQAGKALLRTLIGHSGSVIGAFQLSNGDILTWSTDQTLRLWSEYGVPLNSFQGPESGEPEKPIVPVALNSLDNGSIQVIYETEIWNLMFTGNKIELIEKEINTNRVTAQSNDNQPQPLTVADELQIGISKNALLLMKKGKMVAKLGQHFGPITFLQSLRSNRFITGSRDNTLKLWSIHLDLLEDLSYLDVSTDYTHNGPVIGAGWLPDSNLFTVSQDGSSAKWRSDGKLLQKRPRAQLHFMKLDGNEKEYGEYIDIHHRHIKVRKREGAPFDLPDDVVEVNNNRYGLFEWSKSTGPNGDFEVVAVDIWDIETDHIQAVLRRSGRYYSGTLSCYFILDDGLFVTEQHFDSSTESSRWFFPRYDQQNYLAPDHVAQHPKESQKIDWKYNAWITEEQKVICSTDTIFVLDKQGGQIASFYGDAPFTGCIKISESQILVGDAEGRVLFLQLTL